MQEKNNLRSHYDSKYAVEASREAVESIAPSPWPRNRHEACLKYFPARFRGGDILELGAGSGVIARSLMDVGVPFSTYTLTEYATPRLQGLERAFSDPRFHVRQLDAESIPVSEMPQFDAVIMIALIEHLIDPMKAMAGIRGLLKPGGFAYVDTPNIAKYTRRLKLLLGRFPSTASKDEGLITLENGPADLYDEGHLHYFTYRSLSRMLTQRCGFSRVEKLGYTSGPWVLGRRVDNALAQWWPELFGELALAAYA